MKSRITGNLRRAIPAGLIALTGLGLTGCFDDPESNAVKYAQWREDNEKYLMQEEGRTNPDGSPYYTKIVPSWAPSAYSLVRWHNDRSLTVSKLTPMDNSTVEITYELFNVEGKRLQDSFGNTDSIYTCKPSQNIVGMWAPLTQMNVGDSVTIVIPSQAAYGEVVHGSIPPYSTLIYNVKLKAIKAYEVE